MTARSSDADAVPQSGADASAAIAGARHNLVTGSIGCPAQLALLLALQVCYNYLKSSYEPAYER